MRSHIFTIVVSIGLTTSALIANDHFNEANSIEKVELLGGKVTRKGSSPGRLVVGLSFKGSKRFNDKYIHSLKAFKELATLNLSDTNTTDEALKVILAFPNLLELDLTGSKITLTGLAELKEASPKLRIIEQVTAIQMVNDFGVL